MLQEMKLEDALKKFLQGKKVLVAPARAMDPGKERYLFRSLESVLNGKRFLVEVAAVENPDFKADVWYRRSLSYHSVHSGYAKIRHILLAPVSYFY